MENNNYKSNISLIIDLENNTECINIDELLNSIINQTVKHIQLLIICDKDKTDKYDEYFIINNKRDDISIQYINKKDVLLLYNIIDKISSSFVLFIDKPVIFESGYLHECRSKLIEESYNIICSLVLADFRDYNEYCVECNSYKNLFLKNRALFEISGLIIKKDIIMDIYEQNNSITIDEISTYVFNNLDNYLVYYNNEIIGHRNQKIDSYGIYNKSDDSKSTKKIKKILYISEQINEDIFYIYLYGLNSEDISIKMIDINFYNFYELIGINFVIIDDIHQSGNKWVKILEKLKIPYVLFIHYRNFKYFNDFKGLNKNIIAPYELHEILKDDSIYTFKPLLKKIHLKEKIYKNITNIFIPMKVISSRDIKRITNILDEISKSYNIRVYSYIRIYSEQNNINKEYFQLNQYTNILNEKVLLQELSIDFIMYIGKQNNFEYYKSLFISQETETDLINLEDDMEMIYNKINNKIHNNHTIDEIENKNHNHDILHKILLKQNSYSKQNVISEDINRIINQHIHSYNIEYIADRIRNRQYTYTKNISKINFKNIISKPIEYIELKVITDDIENDIIASLQIYKGNYLLRESVTNIKFSDDKIIFMFDKINITCPVELSFKVKFYVIPPSVKVLKDGVGKYVIKSGLYS